MKVTCTRMKYCRGGFDGQFVEPSKLILYVWVAGQRHEVWVDRFFKDRIGRLTEKRRTAIMTSMPAEIDVEEKTGQKGKKFFAVTEPTLEAWLQRCAL